MIELVHLAWGRVIHLGFNVNEETMKGNDVDDQLPQAPSCVCPIATKSKHPFGVFNYGCDEHAIFYGYIKQDVTFQNY